MRPACTSSFFFLFFLPWFQVSCGVINFDLTGYQLAKGSFDLTSYQPAKGSYEGSPKSVKELRAYLESRKGKNQEENQEAQWWLFVIPVASAIGFLGVLFGFPLALHAIILVLCAAVALGEYVYLLNNLRSTPEAAILVRVSALAPYWLTVILALSNIPVIKFGGVSLYRRRDRTVRGRESLDPTVPPVAQREKSLREQAEEVRQGYRKRGS